MKDTACIAAVGCCVWIGTIWIRVVILAQSERHEVKSFFAVRAAGENAFDFSAVLNAYHARLKITRVEGILTCYKRRGEGPKHPRSEERVGNIDGIHRTVFLVRFFTNHIEISCNHEPVLVHAYILYFLT